MSAETILADQILRHALELQLLAAGDGARAEAILRELEADLRSLMANRNITAASKREIAALIKAADDAIAARYVNIAGVVDVSGIVEHVAERTVTFMEAAYPAVRIGLPSAEVLASLAKDILIDGSPASAWWARQSEDTAFRFASIIRRGKINGLTIDQMAREVFDNGGLMDVARRNVRTLVHSSVMTAANRARLEAFRKNMKPGDKLRWLATLDSHTCKTCVALDGKQWEQDGKPIDHKLDFKVPPAHFSCRCVLSVVPAMTVTNELFDGLGDRLLALGGRASARGPTGADTSMNGFLDRNPDIAETILGQRRVDLWRAGKITLTDLVTASGRPRTLEELRAP